MIVGTFGSFLATAPAQAVLPLIGWHGVIWCCAGASLLIGWWNLLSVPDHSGLSSRRMFREDLQDLLDIIRTSSFRSYAPLAALLTVLNFTYLGLWAGPWLRDVAHLDAPTRANVLLLYTLGLFLGGPFTGTLISAAQRHRRHSMLVPALCTAGLLMVQILLACQPSNTMLVAMLWIFFAILSACGPAAYAAVAGFFPVVQAGRVSTAINTLTLILVFALQIIIGQLVDLWPQTKNGGWNSQGYSVGLMVTIVLQTMALLYAGMRHAPQEPSTT
jgi:MFS family permease